jgi:two-component system chemotaxis response regulator CheY
LATALIADLSDASRRAASHLLERLGFRVATASAAEEALALIAGTAPDLVLADARIETSNGGLLPAAIRKLAAGRETCLFHVTADAGASSIRRAMEAGADDYLVKPYDEALLRFKLMQARARGRIDAGRPKLCVVQDNAATGETSWRFGLYGKAV